MRYKGGGVGHCAIQVHDIGGNTAETDMDNESEYDLDENEVPFNDLDDESDIDSEEGDSDDEGLRVEEDEDELEYI